VNVTTFSDPDWPGPLLALAHAPHPSASRQVTPKAGILGAESPGDPIRFSFPPLETVARQMALGIPMTLPGALCQLPQPGPYPWSRQCLACYLTRC
jgi:hypothetical protein